MGVGLASASMVMLVLDSKCAAQAASESIGLCLTTVIPSLFPMMVLSNYLVPAFGSGGLAVVGILGGFPTGAAAIGQGIRQGLWSAAQGTQWLGICNLCGPGFLFGLAGNCVGHPLAGLGLFLVQLECAWLISIAWNIRLEGSSGGQVPLTQAVSNASRGMVSVCAWVILAGIWVRFFQRWLAPFFPQVVGVVLSGVWELTNGCVALKALESTSLRWMLACGMVSFGGISVALQVGSASGLELGHYLRQKTAMATLALVLGWLTWHLQWLGLLIPIPAGMILKKTVEKPGPLLYNSPKDSKERDTYAVS